MDIEKYINLMRGAVVNNISFSKDKICITFERTKYHDFYELIIYPDVFDNFVYYFSECNQKEIHSHYSQED